MDMKKTNKADTVIYNVGTIMESDNSVCPICGNVIINGRCVRFTQHPTPDKKRVKFIGHAVRDDPNIDVESKRPIERRRLTSTDIDIDITLKNIGRTRRKQVNFDAKKKQSNKIHKPLHESASWAALKREIENEEKKR